MAERILLVEDEQALREVLAYNLKQQGWDPICASTGEEAIALFKARNPDLVIIDIMLPGLSGLDVCRRLRSLSEVPIVFLTARGEEEDKLRGLEAGAEDYVTKPFSLKELVARIQVQLRRSRPQKGPLERGDLLIDRERYLVLKKGKAIQLTRKEFEILWELALKPGKVLAKDLLRHKVWGDDFFGDQNTLQVHIRWLREKIEDDPSRPRYIQTVRGVGYKFRE